MRRFLFVGLGGSGGKTLRFLRNDLQNWLRELDYHKMPAGWQFLHIDTPTDQDGREITDVPMLPSESYVGLVGNGVSYNTVAAQLDGLVEGRQALATWRVDPNHLEVPISVGAGQFRAVGRSIGLAYAGAIAKALKTSIDRLNTASATSELAEIHRRRYDKADSALADPFVIVVSSLAGGTGAGLLLDTCDLIRQHGSWANESFGILYASDVFSEIGGMGTAGVQPNALAALSELVNGYWLNGLNTRDNPYFRMGAAPRPVDRSGPAFPFLVGSANASGISFGSQKSIYAMMGRALSSWATDISIQEKLLAYTVANWQNAAQNNAPIDRNALVTNFQSVFEAFGYAEVGLGTERFGRYSSQRLAKNVANWLYEGHLIKSRQQNPEDSRTPDEIVEQLALDLKVGVLKTLNLDERGQADEVINALRPTAADANFYSGVSEVLRLTLESNKKESADADDWINWLYDDMTTVSEQYTRQYDSDVRSRIAEWVRQKPLATQQAALGLVQESGLRVASRTLELVSAEVKLAVDELSSEADKAQAQIADARGNMKAELPNKGKYRRDNIQIENAARQGLWTRAGMAGESILRRLASELLIDFAEGYIEPLARSLRFAYESLKSKGYEGEGLQIPQVEPWPDEAVTDSLRPPKNEFLVLAIDNFPNEYTRLLGLSTVAERARDKDTEARDHVIDGLFLEAEKIGEQLRQPIIETQGWHPRRDLVLGSTSSRQPATFACAFDPDDLLARADRFIRRPGTAFERFLSTDLRTFLDDDDTVSPAELGQRRRAFTAAFQSALVAAEPLVKISDSLRAQLHPKSPAKKAYPTELPFKDHPMEELASEVVNLVLADEGRRLLSERLTTSNNVRTVSISATLGSAHDPMVFKSITDPIVAGWSQASLAEASKVAFWKNRRARTLREFVPAPQEVLAAMARGWFTGLFLGLIDVERGLITHESGPVQLPRHLLSNPMSRVHDRLPALMEYLGVAYCEVSRVEDLTPLYPYVALREFGRDPGIADAMFIGRYEAPSVVLSQWLRTGTVDGRLTKGLADEDLEKLVASDPTAPSPTPSQRATVIADLAQEVLGSYKAKYDEYVVKARLDPSVLGAVDGLMYSYYDIIEGALQLLRQAALKSITNVDRA